MGHRLRRTSAMALAPSLIAIACCISVPAQGQIYLDGNYGSATDSTQAICTDGGDLYVNFKNDCETGATGGDPITIDGIGFGASGGHYVSYIGRDGKAYFGEHFQVDGDAFFNYAQIDGEAVLNGAVTSQGITNHHGLTNTGSLTNSGGLTNTGGITSSGAFVNNSSFTNNGNVSVRDKLSTDTFTANSAEIAGYMVVGAHLTGNNGATFSDSTTTYDLYASHRLTLGAGATADFGGAVLQNIGAPTAESDATNKAYVDSVAAGASGKADEALAAADHAQTSADQAQASANHAQATADTAVTHEDSLGHDTAGALGGGAAYDPATGHLSAPAYGVGTSTYNSVGAALNAANTGGLAYFHSNTSLPDGNATGANAVAIGGASSAAGAGSLAAGSGAVASADGAVAVGQGAQATGVNAIAIGNGASATGSVAVGVGASAANGGAAYGDRSTATGANAVALGSDASATADNAVALGTGSVATVADTVSVGSAANRRRVINVAAGAAPTDAATVGQIAAGSASIAAALGGGSAASANGTISAPAYALAGTTYHDVGGALLGLSGRIDGVVGLAYDIRKEERRGIAAATALASAPMPSAPGRTSWVTNTAVFHGQVGFGGSIAHRFKTEDSFAVTAGVAYASGGNTIAKFGMAGEF